VGRAPGRIRAKPKEFTVISNQTVRSDFELDRQLLAARVERERAHLEIALGADRQTIDARRQR
jgi:hypothetical protein